VLATRLRAAELVGEISRRLLDVPPDAVACKRVLASDGTRLMITVPLIVAGDVVGCIAFFRLRSPRKFSDEQHGRLRFVGGMFAGSLVRRTTERSLERAETRFTQVVASALDGFAMVSESGVILEWTQQAERILGWRRGEVLGTSLRETLFTLEVARAPRCLGNGDLRGGASDRRRSLRNSGAPPGAG
jgi:PAS domain-containing protein